MPEHAHRVHDDFAPSAMTQSALVRAGFALIPIIALWLAVAWAASLP